MLKKAGFWPRELATLEAVRPCRPHPLRQLERMHSGEGQRGGVKKVRLLMLQL